MCCTWMNEHVCCTWLYVTWLHVHEHFCDILASSPTKSTVSPIVCVWVRCPPPSVWMDSSSCNSHRTNGVNRCQNCPSQTGKPGQGSQAAKYIQPLKRATNKSVYFWPSLDQLSMRRNIPEVAFKKTLTLTPLVHQPSPHVTKKPKGVSFPLHEATKKHGCYDRGHEGI